jgi:ABC-type transport system involved in multi-copper enzyme maturation permease subunit
MFLVYALIFIALCCLFTRGSSLGTFAFLGALFSFLALVNGASLFAPEKEGRKIEMLLSSPISSYAIVRSKLVAGVASPESYRILALALVTAAAFSWWAEAGIFLIAVILFLLFVFMISAAASLHAATLQGAALASWHPLLHPARAADGRRHPHAALEHRRTLRPPSTCSCRSIRSGSSSL